MCICFKSASALLATSLSQRCDFCLLSMQVWSTVFGRARYEKH